MGTGIYSANLDERLDGLVQDAITSAAVLGSLGGSSSIGTADGVYDVVRVERVTQHPAAWRVAHVTVADKPEYTHPLIGKVLVREGLPGRYTSHAISDGEQVIADELAIDEYNQQEPYNPDEDYFRALIHDEDI